MLQWFLSPIVPEKSTNRRLTTSSGRSKTTKTSKNQREIRLENAQRSGHYHKRYFRRIETEAKGQVQIAQKRCMQAWQFGQRKASQETQSLQTIEIYAGTSNAHALMYVQFRQSAGLWCKQRTQLIISQSGTLLQRQVFQFHRLTKEQGQGSSNGTGRNALVIEAYQETNASTWRPSASKHTRPWPLVLDSAVARRRPPRVLDRPGVILVDACTDAVVGSNQTCRDVPADPQMKGPPVGDSERAEWFAADVVCGTVPLKPPLPPPPSSLRWYSY